MSAGWLRLDMIYFAFMLGAGEYTVEARFDVNCVRTVFLMILLMLNFIILQ